MYGCKYENLHVCVCVCVCVRERERERETDKQREDSSAHEDVLFISDTRMTQTSAEEDAKQQILAPLPLFFTGLLLPSQVPFASQRDGASLFCQ